MLADSINELEAAGWHVLNLFQMETGWFRCCLRRDIYNPKTGSTTFYHEFAEAARPAEAAARATELLKQAKYDGLPAPVKPGPIEYPPYIERIRTNKSLEMLLDEIKAAGWTVKYLFRLRGGAWHCSVRSDRLDKFHFNTAEARTATEAAAAVLFNVQNGKTETLSSLQQAVEENKAAWHKFTTQLAHWRRTC